MLEDLVRGSALQSASIDVKKESLELIMELISNCHENKLAIASMGDLTYENFQLIIMILHLE